MHCRVPVLWHKTLYETQTLSLLLLALVTCRGGAGADLNHQQVFISLPLQSPTERFENSRLKCWFFYPSSPTLIFVKSPTIKYIWGIQHYKCFLKSPWKTKGLICCCWSVVQGGSIRLAQSRQPVIKVSTVHVHSRSRLTGLYSLTRDKVTDPHDASTNTSLPPLPVHSSDMATHSRAAPDINHVCMS